MLMIDRKVSNALKPIELGASHFIPIDRSRLAIQPSAILTGFVLIDIGLTFGYSVGVMGQMFTAASIAAMVTALLMSILSIKYSHKSLFIDRFYRSSKTFTGWIN